MLQIPGEKQKSGRCGQKKSGTAGRKAVNWSRQQEPDDPEEKTEMMNQIMALNMANMMAEDAGLYELRNPEISGLRAKGLFARLFSKKRRY